jgi:tetratricopeptide (TPR) repeat protein
METSDLERLRQAAQTAPEDAAARLALLQALVETAAWAEAEAVGEALLQMVSPSPATHALMGIVYGQRKRNDEAVRQCQLALDSGLEDPLLQYNFGVILARQGDFEAALKALQRATHAYKAWPAAHYNQGVVLLRLERYSDAVEAFESAIEHCEVYPEAHFSRGNAHAMLGLPAEGGLDYYEIDCAINAYKQAVQQRPGYAAALYNLGVLYGRMTASEGIRVWEQYLAATQDLPEETTWQMRAQEYLHDLQDRLR